MISWVVLGLSVIILGLSLWFRPRLLKRTNVYRFTDGQEVSALYFFEWLAINNPDRWPPMGEVIEVARAVGSGFTAVEIDRIVTAVRPMAMRAVSRGERALKAPRA